MIITTTTMILPQVLAAARLADLAQHGRALNGQFVKHITYQRTNNNEPIQIIHTKQQHKHNT